MSNEANVSYSFWILLLQATDYGIYWSFIMNIYISQHKQNQKPEILNSASCRIRLHIWESNTDWLTERSFQMEGWKHVDCSAVKVVVISPTVHDVGLSPVTTSNTRISASPCVFKMRLLSLSLKSTWLYSWFQTFAVFWIYFVFFWVFPRRLNYICRRFGTLYLLHLHRQVEQIEYSETSAYIIQTPGKHPKENII